MLLIGISGKKGVGKDLFASYLTRNYGFINIPFAAELKENVRRDFNLSPEHTDGKLKESPLDFTKAPVLQEMPHYGKWTPREIMIAYGQFFRQFDPLWWVKKTFRSINTIKSKVEMANWSDDARVSISDVRFKNEANYIKENGGYLVRLERKPELNIYKTISYDVSETDLDNYDKWDFKIDANDNVTPLDLDAFACIVMASLSQKVV